LAVDIVTLVYAADARPLDEVTKAFDRNTAAAARNDAAERKRLTATERAGVTMQRSADATVRATRAATDHAKAQGAVEKATRDADRAAQQSLAFRMRMNAQAIREATTAAKAQAAAQNAADRDAERSAQQLLQFRIRMARQRATEEAKAARDSQAAQIAADRDAERSAQQLLAFRVRMAKQRAAEEARAAREQAAAVASLEARIDTLKGSIDPTYAAQKRLNAEMQEATALYKMGAISASDYATAVGILDQRMDAAARGQASMGGLHAAGAKGARLQAHEMANLGSQFADIGVSLASGQALWLVAIQQGAQIGGVYGSAAARGATLSGVLGQLGTAVGSVASKFGPLLIVVAATAAAMALFHREVGKDQDAKKLIASLNLTEEQLKRVKDETITFGDTMKATFQVLGRYIMDSPVGKAIEELRDKINAWLDEFATNSVKEVAVIVGAFTGAWAGIKAVWQNFPAVMKDIGATAANAFIGAIESMINRAIDAVNKFMASVKQAAGMGLLGPGMMGLAGAIRPIGGVTLERVNNTSAGAAANVGAAVSGGFASGRDATISAAGRFLQDVRDQREKNFLKDVREKAGDANKAPKGPGTPRDMTDERLAQLAAEEARVRQDHLQAMLAVTRDFRARAELERQILALAVLEKQAGYDKLIATTRDEITAKKITEVRGLELIQAYERLKAQVGLTGVVQQIAINETEIRTATEAELELRRAQQQGSLDIQKAQASLLRSEFARNVAGVSILEAEQAIARDAIEQQILKADQLGLTAEQVAILKVQLDAMKATHAAEVKIAERATTLSEAMRDARNSVRDFKDAFRSQDWDRMFDSLASAIETLQASFSKFGLAGGLATAGGMIGSLVGGKTGRTIGKTAGYLGGGLAVGAYASSAAGAAALGGLGLSAGAISGLAAAAPIVGAVVAGLYALSKVFGPKPTNAGAGFDLITGQFSGKNRTEETEGAVRQAGDAILQAQDMLKSFGLTLNETINGLVIGSRDASQIYTSSGKTLTAAKGDPAAAVEAALAAVLDGADFVSDAQKKLVTSMREAGKGFDDIAAALQHYAAAQQMITAVNDEILRLTDPKAFDLQALSRAYDEQKKAAEANYKAGYLTADQLTELTAALARLNGLQIDEVMGRYGDDLIAGLTDQLQAAFEADSAALRAHADEFRQFADSLKGYSEQIRGAMIETLSPGQQLGATSRRFQNVASLAAQGDKGALGQFQGAAEAFRAASAQYSPDAATNRRNLAAIQRATQDAYDAAQDQVDYAEAQLAVLKEQVAPYLNDIRTNTLSTVEALKALQAALTARGGGGAGAGGAGAVDPVHAQVKALEASGGGLGLGEFDPARYAAAAGDVVSEFQKYASGSSAYQSFYASGMTLEDFLKAHYDQTGRYEIAAGVRGYARGTNSASPGWAWVGEEGPELMRFRGGEQVVPTSAIGNDNGRSAAAIERQNQLLEQQNRLLMENTRQAKKTADLLQRVTRDGESLVTVAA
jgi:hypothetical protein